MAMCLFAKLHERNVRICNNRSTHSTVGEKKLFDVRLRVYQVYIFKASLILGCSDRAV